MDDDDTSNLVIILSDLYGLRFVQTRNGALKKSSAPKECRILCRVCFAAVDQKQIRRHKKQNPSPGFGAPGK